MSDEEKLSLLSGILDQSTQLIRSLVDEIRQYRDTDREDKILAELEEITGKEVRHGNNNCQ